MIYLLWFFWFINIFLMLIILLNFLIAVISATYEKVNSQKINYTYKDKAEMNEECCTILKSLYNKGEVKLICFTYDKNLTIIQESDYKEVIDEIKKNVKAATDDINETISDIGEQIKNSINSVLEKKFTDQTNERNTQITALKNEMNS